MKKASVPYLCVPCPPFVPSFLRSFVSSLLILALSPPTLADRILPPVTVRPLPLDSRIVAATVNTFTNVEAPPDPDPHPSSWSEPEAVMGQDCGCIRPFPRPRPRLMALCHPPRPTRQPVHGPLQGFTRRATNQQRRHPDKHRPPWRRIGFQGRRCYHWREQGQRVLFHPGKEGRSSDPLLETEKALGTKRSIQSCVSPLHQRTSKGTQQTHTCDRP